MHAEAFPIDPRPNRLDAILRSTGRRTPIDTTAKSEINVKGSGRNALTRRRSKKQARNGLLATVLKKPYERLLPSDPVARHAGPLQMRCGPKEVVGGLEE